LAKNQNNTNNFPFIYLDEEKWGLVKNQNNTKNILLFI